MAREFVYTVSGPRPSSRAAMWKVVDPSFTRSTWPGDTSSAAARPMACLRSKSCATFLWYSVSRAARPAAMQPPCVRMMVRVCGQLLQIPADRERRNPEHAGELVDPQLGLHGPEKGNDFLLSLLRFHFA